MKLILRMIEIASKLILINILIHGVYCDTVSPKSITNQNKFYSKIRRNIFLGETNNSNNQVPNTKRHLQDDLTTILENDLSTILDEAIANGPAPEPETEPTKPTSASIPTLSPTKENRPLTTQATTIPTSETKIISVQFSVQLFDHAYENHENEKDNERPDYADDKLSEALLQTTTQFLCEDTTFFIVSRIAPSRDICLAFKRAKEEENQEKNLNNANNNNRKLQLSRTKLLVDPYNAIAEARHVISMNQTDIQWLEVGVDYEVLETSDQVLILSDQSVGRLSPLQIIERTAELVTGQRIDDGTFGETLREGDDRVKRVSIKGLEEQVFSISDEVQTVVYDPIKPLHTLRVAGIILFTFMFCLTTILFTAATTRNRESKWEKERMQDGPGGLATDQGVDAMLEVGRMKAKSNANHPITTFS